MKIDPMKALAFLFGSQSDRAKIAGEVAKGEIDREEKRLVTKRTKRTKRTGR